MERRNVETLSERQRSILKVVVAEHVVTAQPVGSDVVARKLNLGVSPATVRNEMAELRGAGLPLPPAHFGGSAAF